MNLIFISLKRTILLSFGILMLFSVIHLPAFAQRELTQSEQQWVEEAKSELERAISEPDLSQQERIEIVQRSAKTLKEYGQPYAFPTGDIPLKKFMQENYNQSRKQFKNSNDLRQILSNKLLDQQLKIINTMQIEVTEQQIKFMLPGNQVIDLSKDVVTTVIDWDIVGGVNGGAQGNAKGLLARFKQLAQSKELIKQLNALYNAQRVSMQNLHADLNRITPMQEMLRKRYQMAEAGAFTFDGYEGAVIGTKNSSVATVSNASTPSSTSTASSVTTNNNDDFVETKYLFKLVKVEPVKKMNRPEFIESLSVSESGMSASVKPPKPDDPFSVSASWNSPPSIIYPGDNVIMQAKGNGDVRLSIEAHGASNLHHQGVRESNGKNSTVTFNWEVDAGAKFYIEVNALVTAHIYGWASVFYHYEMEIIN